MSSLALSNAYSPAPISAAPARRAPRAFVAPALPSAAAAPLAPAWDAGRLLVGSRQAMGYSALVVAAAVVLAYPLAHYLSLPAQIVAHLAIPVAAGVFKLGYVARLAAQDALARAT
ncbi:hypothetical protein LNV23_00410 [Paucibacter sp. DJ1R-11]|uniref:hypothetical protein n=1 Tax=Paucibacter sp. DJ1R-11 TaxID=2893556 RepID=UPI0021E45294|nr:hypothetical protein [Paucibacter sp. DJ1R-11]MCV2361905.1 hypothetical protein [Paucibacter sp. DJ1R-11]